MDPRAVRQDRRFALLGDRQRELRAEQRITRLARQRAERVVRVGDRAVRGAAHDEVALGFDDAFRVLFGVAELPILVAELLDPRFEAPVRRAQRVNAKSQHGERDAEPGEDRDRGESGGICGKPGARVDTGIAGLGAERDRQRRRRGRGCRRPGGAHRPAIGRRDFRIASAGRLHAYPRRKLRRPPRAK